VRCSLAVTYSSNSKDFIHTTDVNNKCTHKHGGTSAAAPLAAGIFALVLQTRPDLTWRDLQWLIVETSKVIDPQDRDWQMTGAGYYFSHKYGFGKLDSYAIVEMAKTFQHVTEQKSITLPPKTLPEASSAIPQGDVGLVSEITVTNQD